MLINPLPQTQMTVIVFLIDNSVRCGEKKAIQSKGTKEQGRRRKFVRHKVVQKQCQMLNNGNR